jgi:MFS family permease
VDRAPEKFEPPLFTARFLVMCGFTFTVFLSVFQFLPVAPFRIVDLGGSKVAAGMFLGCLTYASAMTAPFTGALADRVGHRRMLIVCSFVITLFSVAYALADDYRVPLVLAVLHGFFWSGLLSASAARVTEIIPPSRRAEGISYWGLSTIVAIGVAPPVGFWVYAHGWVWLCAVSAALNVGMLAIAWQLERDTTPRPTRVEPGTFSGPFVEWRVLLVSGTLFLYSFGYGGITSFVAMYAESNGVAPKGIFYTAFAVVTLATRPFLGRLADRIGHRRVLLPCLFLIAVGLSLLALDGSWWGLVTAAVVFASGFGTAYPAFVGCVLDHVPSARRGAAFGSILAAFDTGIGTGSIASGWIIQHHGFRAAFATAAVLSAFSVPFFLLTEKRVLGETGRDIAPPTEEGVSA